MADEVLATRAPESDAQEVSGIEGDTKPDQGAASMGEITKFNDTEVYITKPADYPHAPSKLLLLLTGGTGVHSTNNQLQADKYAGEGFLVVMPDQFAGDPAPTTTTSSGPAEAHPSIIEQVKLGVASVAKSFTIDMWLARHTPEKVLPILHKVITSVKEEFADAVANGGGIYAVGYCFGAKYVLLLGSSALHQLDSAHVHVRAPESDAEEGIVKQGPQIKCGAIAHGTQISQQDMAEASVPMCVVAVEDDPLFPDRVRNEGLEAMKAKKLDHEFRVYPDVPHGFAVLGDYADGGIVEKQGEAFEQMLGWLKRH
ncbi:hypothetical protein LTR85_007501 [Meristemomyces frigidus]|nr:hypothetical protein LTR85_007501 [Meristemomyces frigidus]